MINLKSACDVISVNAYGLYLIQLEIETIIVMAVLDGSMFCIAICCLHLCDMLMLMSQEKACACQVSTGYHKIVCSYMGGLPWNPFKDDFNNCIDAFIYEITYIQRQ